MFNLKRLSLNEATLLIKYDCDDVIEKVYMYWTKKRKNCVRFFIVLLCFFTQFGWIYLKVFYSP